jgi:hypothetical protein
MGLDSDLTFRSDILPRKNLSQQQKLEVIDLLLSILEESEDPYTGSPTLMKIKEKAEQKKKALKNV